MIQYKKLTAEYDYLAPDKSEIRLFPTVKRGGAAHCMLPAGKTSTAVKHKTVEEIWYILSGAGKMWQQSGDVVNSIELGAGVVLHIPTGNHFQFSNTGTEPLCILIFTMPPWPGPDEAIILTNGLTGGKNNDSKIVFDHKLLPAKHDELAPDGSEIRLLLRSGLGSCVHCVLPKGRTSLAVKHKTIEEIWYVLSGVGEMWQRSNDAECVVKLQDGVAVTIPTGNQFQFRNTGAEPLCIVILTMPPWSGNDEAENVVAHWKT